MFSFIKKVFGKRDVSDGKVQETPSWDNTVKAAEVASPVVKPAPKVKAKTTPKTPKVVAKTTAVKAKAAAITPTQTAPTKKKVQPKK